MHLVNHHWPSSTGWAEKKIMKKGRVLNPGKLHKNRFENEIWWLPLATT